jgi:hypothetical protein
VRIVFRLEPPFNEEVVLLIVKDDVGQNTAKIFGANPENRLTK